MPVQRGRQLRPIEAEQHRVGLKQLQARHARGGRIHEVLLGSEIVAQLVAQPARPLRIVELVPLLQRDLELLVGILVLGALQVLVAQHVRGARLDERRLPLGGHARQQRRRAIGITAGHQQFRLGDGQFAFRLVEGRRLVQAVQKLAGLVQVAGAREHAAAQQLAGEPQLARRDGLQHVGERAVRRGEVAQFPEALRQLQGHAVALPGLIAQAEVLAIRDRRLLPVLQRERIVARHAADLGAEAAVGKRSLQLAQVVLAAVDDADQQVVQRLQVQRFLEVRRRREVLEKQVELADRHAVRLETVVCLRPQIERVIGQVVARIIVDDLLRLGDRQLVVALLLAGRLGRVLVLAQGVLADALGVVEGLLGVVVGVVLGAAAGSHEQRQRHRARQANPRARTPGRPRERTVRPRTATRGAASLQALPPVPLRCRFAVAHTSPWNQSR